MTVDDQAVVGVLRWLATRPCTMRLDTMQDSDHDGLAATTALLSTWHHLVHASHCNGIATCLVDASLSGHVPRAGMVVTLVAASLTHLALCHCISQACFYSYQGRPSESAPRYRIWQFPSDGFEATERSLVSGEGAVPQMPKTDKR